MNWWSCPKDWVDSMNFHHGNHQHLGWPAPAILHHHLFSSVHRILVEDPFFSIPWRTKQAEEQRFSWFTENLQPQRGLGKPPWHDTDLKNITSIWVYGAAFLGSPSLPSSSLDSKASHQITAFRSVAFIVLPTQSDKRVQSEKVRL